jgi:hypothetical protein
MMAITFIVDSPGIEGPSRHEVTGEERSREKRG